MAPHVLEPMLQPPEPEERPARAEGDQHQVPHTLGPAVPYARLLQEHAEYDGGYWRELRALYEGGKYLLRNPQVMASVFPKHEGEREVVYQERKRRAYYIAHLSTVIDAVVAGLASDPVRLLPPGTEEDDEQEAELDEFWKEFCKDCSPPGGARVEFSELLLDQAKTGLLLGRFATLVDLPRMGADFKNLLQQKEAGALDPYAVPVAPECLLDWEVDQAGELRWVNYRTVSTPRESIAADRDTVIEEYRVYTRDDWTLYRVEYSIADNGPKKRPKPEDVIQPADGGAHTIGRVPIIVQVLPPGLWAGNKIHSMAVEYLNKACGLSWAEYKAVYAQLYEFLAPELSSIDSVPNEHQADPARPKRTPRGPGNVQVRGNEDKAAYVSPDTAGFEHVAQQLSNLRQDIYRVTYQMALAEDNTGGLVRRSAESKEVDHEVTGIILGALGKRVLRPHAERVVDTGAAARGEDVGWSARGYENFVDVDVNELVERAGTIELIPIESATYQRARKLKLAKADLGDDATPAVVAAIEKELAETITQDSLAMRAEADLLEEEARGEEGAARSSEAGRVQRGQLPVSAKKPPKPAGASRGKK